MKISLETHSFCGILSRSKKNPTCPCLNHTHTEVTVQQQRLVIPNNQGEKLVGILHESGTRDIVILCHGFGCSKDTNLILNLAVALENAKIGSFRFDFSGNGESEGSFQFCDLWKDVDDLHAVIQHFRESNREIGAIVGHSKGGDSVLLYASKYGGIKTVLNISGRYDMKATIEQKFGKDCLERVMKDGYIDVKVPGRNDFRVTKEYLMDLLGTMLEACPQIDKECRVLTIHGSSDEVNRVEDAFEFAKIIPNHKLHIIEGADHMYSNHQGELSSVVVNFVAETLHLAKGTDN